MSDSRTPDYPIDALFTRRWSPRSFTGDGIEPAELFALLEAARWAPSGFNAQPWRFIYGRRDTPGWDPIFHSLAEFNQGWAHRAAALVLIISKTRWIPPGQDALQPITSHSFDAGAAWASLAFQATLSGWSTHGIGGFDKEKARAALAVPEDYAIEAVVAIGRRGDKDQLPPGLQARETPNQREPLVKLVADGRFDFPGG